MSSLRNQPKKSSRGPGFTPVEDIAIAKAWIAASEDPIVGTDQKGADFYKSIQAVYNKNFKPVNREDRSLDSIKNRCRAIHKESMSFSGCFTSVVRSHPLGVSCEDMVNMATALYNKVEMRSAGEDYGKPFKFLGAWRILKQHDKFVIDADGTTNKGRSDKDTAENGASGSDNGSGVESSGGDGGGEGDNGDGAGGVGEAGGGGKSMEEEVALGSKKERPIGRKRAKEEKQKREQSAKKLRIGAASVAAQKERNVALKRHYEIMLFTNAPSACNDEDAVEYFNIMRARALADIRKGTATNENERGDEDKGDEGQ